MQAFYGIDPLLLQECASQDWPEGPNKNSAIHQLYKLAYALTCVSQGEGKERKDFCIGLELDFITGVRN